MAFRMNHNDNKVLRSLAEYRILTPTQITTFYQKTRQVVWRRLHILEKEGLIQSIRHEFGRGHGRPENLLGLTEYGIDILIGKKPIGKDISYENILVDGPFCIDHQLLLNWFRIHLNQIGRVLPRMTVKFLAHSY